MIAKPAVAYIPVQERTIAALTGVLGAASGASKRLLNPLTYMGPSLYRNCDGCARLRGDSGVISCNGLDSYEPFARTDVHPCIQTLYWRCNGVLCWLCEGLASRGQSRLSMSLVACWGLRRRGKRRSAFHKHSPLARQRTLYRHEQHEKAVFRFASSSATAGKATERPLHGAVGRRQRARGSLSCTITPLSCTTDHILRSPDAVLGHQSILNVS